MWYVDSSERIGTWSRLFLESERIGTSSRLFLECRLFLGCLVVYSYADCRADQRKSERLRLDRRKVVELVA